MRHILQPAHTAFLTGALHIREPIIAPPSSTTGQHQRHGPSHFSRQAGMGSEQQRDVFARLQRADKQEKPIRQSMSRAHLGLQRSVGARKPALVHAQRHHTHALLGEPEVRHNLLAGEFRNGHHMISPACRMAPKQIQHCPPAIPHPLGVCQRYSVHQRCQNRNPAQPRNPVIGGMKQVHPASERAMTPGETAPCQQRGQCLRLKRPDRQGTGHLPGRFALKLDGQQVDVPASRQYRQQLPGHTADPIDAVATQSPRQQAYPESHFHPAAPSLHAKSRAYRCPQCVFASDLGLS